MYYLADVNGYVGDFGNIEMVNLLRGVALNLDLKEATTFFDQGFTTKPESLLRELKGVDFGFTILNDVVVEDILPALEKSSEIFILTTDID